MNEPQTTKPRPGDPPRDLHDGPTILLYVKLNLTAICTTVPTTKDSLFPSLHFLVASFLFLVTTFLFLVAAFLLFRFDLVTGHLLRRFLRIIGILGI